MKRLMIILIFTFGIIFLINITANAETYKKVKKGDTLDKIAQRHGLTVRDLRNANPEIKNPNLILVNQTLKISKKPISTPAVKTVKSDFNKPVIKSVKSNQPFFWENPGGNPFGSRDKIKAIRASGWPMDVQAELIEKIQSGDYVLYQVKAGDHFDWMGFGEYEMVVNVIAAWTTNKLYIARLYVSERADKTYNFYDVRHCGNPAGRVTVRTTKEEPSIEQPAQEEPPVKAEPEKEAAITPPIEPAKPIVVPEYKPKKGFSIKPAAEVSIFGGHYWAAPGQGAKTGFTYYGYSASFFPAEYSLSQGTLRVGPNVEQIGWKGNVGDNVTFSGHKDLVGAEGQFFSGNTKTSLKVRQGRKVGQTKVSDNGDLEINEKAKITSLEATYQWWNNRKWLSLWEVGARADISSRESSKASMLGHRGREEIASRAVNQSEYSARVRADIYQGKYATPFAEISGGNRRFDEKNFGEGTVGLKLFQDVLEVKGSYQMVEGSKNDLVGVGAVINLHNLFSWLKNINSKDAAVQPAVRNSGEKAKEEVKTLKEETNSPDPFAKREVYGY